MKISKIKQIVDRWSLILGIGLAIATILGFLGKLFWLFDLCSHFRVQFFQAALVLIGISIWRRQNKRLVIFVLLAGLNYAVVLPFYFGNPPVATEQPIRAMLLNLYAENGNAEQVLTAIQSVDPDLLLLEEVTPKWEDALRVLESTYPYHVSEVRNDCFGILLFSKYPLSHTKVMEIGDAGVPSIIADAHLPHGEISLIGTHPLPPFNATYSSHRNHQLSALPAVIRKQQNPVLLIGDLNVSPWSPHFSQLLQESGLKNSMDHFGFQPSWPVNLSLLRIPIDHMLHSPQIQIHHRSIGPAVGSDHFPVIIDFTLKRPHLNH